MEKFKIFWIFLKKWFWTKLTFLFNFKQKTTSFFPQIYFLFYIEMYSQVKFHAIYFSQVKNLHCICWKNILWDLFSPTIYQKNLFSRTLSFFVNDISTNNFLPDNFCFEKRLCLINILYFSFYIGIPWVDFNFFNSYSQGGGSDVKYKKWS